MSNISFALGNSKVTAQQIINIPIIISVSSRLLNQAGGHRSNKVKCRHHLPGGVCHHVVCVKPCPRPSLHPLIIGAGKDFLCVCVKLARWSIVDSCFERELLTAMK